MQSTITSRRCLAITFHIEIEIEIVNTVLKGFIRTMTFFFFYPFFFNMLCTMFLLLLTNKLIQANIVIF